MALYGLSGSSDGSSEDCTLYWLCVVSMLMLSEYGGTMPARCAHDMPAVCVHGMACGGAVPLQKGKLSHGKRNWNRMGRVDV